MTKSGGKKRLTFFSSNGASPFLPFYLFTFLPLKSLFTFKKLFYFLFSSMFEGMSSKISFMRFVSNLGVRS